MRLSPSREFALAPKLQRCCWYVIAAWPALAVVFLLVARFCAGRGPGDITFGLVLFSLLAAAPAVLLRWRVRTDDQGVSRRLVWRWDLWTWTDLASGRIRKLHPYKLLDPARPWWRQTLNLEFVGSEVRQELLAQINSHYQLPPPPAVPDSLTIRYGFRHKLIFDAKGIRHFVGRVPTYYPWSEIAHARITRMDPLRRDFSGLIVVLPDREIELKIVGDSPNWRGAASEEINEYLRHNLPADRIEAAIAGEPPRKRAQIERGLLAAKRNARDFRIVMAVFLPLMVGVLIWIAIQDGIVKSVVMALLYSIPSVPLVLFLWRSQQRQIREWTHLLDSVKDSSET
jgi:hypothetical protein